MNSFYRASSHHCAVPPSPALDAGARDRRSTHSCSLLPDDLQGVAIFGLDWLINAPKIEGVPLDERGYPIRMVDDNNNARGQSNR